MPGSIPIPATTGDAVEQVVTALHDLQQKEMELEELGRRRDLCGSERRELKKKLELRRGSEIQRYGG